MSEDIGRSLIDVYSFFFKKKGEFNILSGNFLLFDESIFKLDRCRRSFSLKLVFNLLSIADNDCSFTGYASSIITRFV